MSSVAATADRLVRQEMLDRGVKIAEARRIVAREAGIAPGTFESLKRDRIKYVDRIAAKINAVLIRRIERKIAELEAELAVARLAAARPDDADILGAQAAVEEARRLLGKV
jgi:hypothetical protein